MANETIIKAAGLAYTKETVDVSAQVQTMAFISKLATSMVDAANKKANELSTAFDVDFGDGNKELEQTFFNIRNSTELTYKQKMEKAKVFKNNKNLWGELKNKLEVAYGKKTSTNPGGEVLISGSTTPAVQSWHTSIITGSLYGNATIDSDGNKIYSLQDLNKDGEIDDTEAAFKPMKVIDGKIKVISPDGTTYIDIEGVNDDLPKTSDSDGIEDFVYKTYSPSKKDVDNINDIPGYVEDQVDLLHGDLVGTNGNPTAAGLSFTYDKALRVDDSDKKKTLVEYYLETYGEKLIEGESIPDEEGGEVDALSLKIIKDYNSYIEGTNKDGLIMTAKDKKALGNNLFRSIIAENAENLDIGEELLKFIKLSITYKVGKKFNQ